MTKSSKSPKIFLSYSWKDKEEASVIENDFYKIGIQLIKDTINIKFKDSISNYMKSIRNADFAIILISENYLKSQNCMFEALEILKDQNHTKKILPIFIKNPKIFNAKERIKFVKYWKQQKEELNEELKNIDTTSTLSSYKDLKNLENIYSSIDEFLKKITDLKSSTLEELKKENYKSIIDYLDLEEVSYLIDLLFISRIENYSLKEIAINNHLEKFGKSSHALFSKAQTKENLGKKEEAKLLYKESLKIEGNNSATWNNLGFLLDKQFNQINKAFDCYKKAIEIEPNLIVARINLATVYSRKNKFKKAKDEYQKILEIAPHESKAHNNLANIYRNYKEKDKIIYHLTEAIKYNPKYVEAYVNLANYYDIELNESEKAIEYYNTAKKISNDSNINIMIDKMIEKHNKKKK